MTNLSKMTTTSRNIRFFFRIFSSLSLTFVFFILVWLDATNAIAATQSVIKKLSENGKLERKKYIEKLNWTRAESNLVLDKFHHYVTSDKLPGKKECQKLLDENNEIFQRGRKWSNLKDFVKNRKTTLKRKLQKVQNDQNEL